MLKICLHITTDIDPLLKYSWLFISTSEYFLSSQGDGPEGWSVCSALRETSVPAWALLVPSVPSWKQTPSTYACDPKSDQNFFSYPLPIILLLAKNWCGIFHFNQNKINPLLNEWVISSLVAFELVPWFLYANFELEESAKIEILVLDSTYCEIRFVYTRKYQVVFCLLVC